MGRRGRTRWGPGGWAVFTHCAHRKQQHSWMENIVLDLVELKVNGQLGEKAGSVTLV